MNKIEISFICDEMKYRPRVSHKIARYFEAFIQKEIFGKMPHIKFIPKNWKLVFGISFYMVEDDFVRNEIEIDILPKQEIKSELTNLYSIMLPLNLLETSKDRFLAEFNGLLYEVIRLVLIEEFNLEDNFLKTVRAKIDWNYLNSLEYPVAFDEQKYAFDQSSETKNEYFQIFDR